jgi:hypothetical protein
VSFLCLRCALGIDTDNNVGCDNQVLWWQCTSIRFSSKVLFGESILSVRSASFAPLDSSVSLLCARIVGRWDDTLTQLGNGIDQMGVELGKVSFSLPFLKYHRITSTEHDFQRRNENRFSPKTSWLN